MGPMRGFCPCNKIMNTYAGCGCMQKLEFMHSSETLISLSCCNEIPSAAADFFRTMIILIVVIILFIPLRLLLLLLLLLLFLMLLLQLLPPHWPCRWQGL